MAVSIDSLNNQIQALKLNVGSYDFRINSLQLTINQLEATVKGLNKAIADLKSSTPKVITVNGQDLPDFLNGQQLNIVN